VTGFCSQYLSHLDADIIVNYSRVASQDGYSMIANTLGTVLGQIAHRKCLEMILPLLCRYVFVTCDPAYNTSEHQVYQPICRHGCDVVSLFVCPTVWQLLTSQRDVLEFDVLDSPMCGPLVHANGGDVPDCIDTTDGGNFVSKQVQFLILFIVCARALKCIRKSVVWFHKGSFYARLKCYDLKLVVLYLPSCMCA